METKICNHCKVEKPITEFKNRKSRPCGKQGHCKDCNNIIVNNARKRFKLQCLEYKGMNCSICGYGKCHSALEFHHLDPSQKEFIINTGGSISFKKVKPELDKCVLLCANCHREVHSGLVSI